MASLLSLLLPALLPSWRFFKSVEPSPRLEYALLDDPALPADLWQEFRPRPARLGPFQMARRLLWNPRWNETLFLVSCAERLIAAPCDRLSDEIHSRLAVALPQAPHPGGAPPWLQFRLVFHDRQDGRLVKAVTYTSQPQPLAPGPCP